MAVSRTQVEHALSRILASDVFTGGRNVAPERTAGLLNHVVVGTLDNIPLTQNALLIDFYGLTTDEVDASRDDARVGMLRLRKKLADYYATEGVDDPIVIAIPKGQYRASFSDNLTSPAWKEVILGYHHVDQETPDHVKQALMHFDKAIGMQPGLADAWAGKASAYLTMALHAYENEPEPLLIDAEECATRARGFDETCWKAHANIGAVALFRHDWTLAHAEFERAKQIAPLEISTIGGYGPYLLGCGHYREAAELARYYRDAGFDHAVSLTRAGLYFYVMRNFQQATETLLQAIERSPNFWRSHLVLAFVYLSLKEPEKALSQMEEVTYCARRELWPGMRIMCLEETGQSEKAERQFGALLEYSTGHYVQPVQLAMGHLALGDVETATGRLSDACDASDPFTAWLHLWPFLDALRPHRNFRELLRRWRFPSFASTS